MRGQSFANLRLGFSESGFLYKNKSIRLIFTCLPLRIASSVLLTLSITLISGCSDSHRWEKDLSGPGWRLYLDHDAHWQNDKLYLPPVDLNTLPVIPPGCGWENLPKCSDKSVTVPGTVEGYFWGIPDSAGHKMGDYRGVSWWSKEFKVPSKLRGKRLTLKFQSVNLRAEVFVNHKLVGYDLIGNTPFEVDITGAVSFSGSNNLDIRITDIGGTFSWDDEKALTWGGYSVPSVHGFGGITGNVSLCATDEVHIDDIYVQNQSTLKDIKVFVNLGNTGESEVDGNIDLVVHKWNSPEKILMSHSETVKVSPGSQEVIFSLSANDAELWRVKDPHLYLAEVKFISRTGV
jgi:beta-galactosidase